MTIDEAIVIMEDLNDNPLRHRQPKDRAAIQLAIQALLRCKAYKEAHIGLHYEPMPGETTEEERAERGSHAIAPNMEGYWAEKRSLATDERG